MILIGLFNVAITGAGQWFLPDTSGKWSYISPIPVCFRTYKAYVSLPGIAGSKFSELVMAFFSKLKLDDSTIFDSHGQFQGTL